MSKKRGRPKAPEPSTTGQGIPVEEPTGLGSWTMAAPTSREEPSRTISSGYFRRTSETQPKSGNEPQGIEDDKERSLRQDQKASVTRNTSSTSAEPMSSFEAPELFLAMEGVPAYSLERMKEMIPLVQQGRLDDAEALAYAGLKESPDCPSYWDVLADIEETRGEKDESSRLREVGIQALRHFSEQAGISPARDALEGWTLWKSERFEEAILALRRLEPFLEGDTAAFFQLLIGSSCVMAKRLREGRIALERASLESNNKYVVQEASKGLNIIASMRCGIAQVLEVAGISFEDLMQLEDMQGEDGAEAREIWEVGDLSKPLSEKPKEGVGTGLVADGTQVRGDNYIQGRGVEIGITLAQAAAKDGIYSWSSWLAMLRTVMGNEDFELWFEDVGGIDVIKRIWAEHSKP